MEIIPRARWGARHDDGAGPAPLPASEVWLHHSAGLWPDLAWIDADGDGVEDDEERAMRTLEDIGEQRFGRGISYTFVVMPSGRAYVGHSVGRLGAHTGGRNGIARAICWAGNYMTNRPTAAQIATTAALLRHGKAQGWWREAKLRGGHRDVLPMTGDSVATACPGDHAYAVIAEINRQAAAAPQGEDDDMFTDDDRQMILGMRNALGLAELSDGTDPRPHIGARVARIDVALQGGIAGVRGAGHVYAAAHDAKVAAETALAKLDALAGTVTTGQAQVLAAVRAIDDAGDVSPEQHAAILRDLLPGAVLSALVDLAARPAAG